MAAPSMHGVAAAPTRALCLPRAWESACLQLDSITGRGEGFPRGGPNAPVPAEAEGAVGREC